MTMPTVRSGYIAEETIQVETSRVVCDGNGGSLGHPRIYLTVDAHTRSAVCPYCSRKYVLKDGIRIGGGH